MKVPAHEATTAQIGAAFPMVSAPSLPGGGVFVGRERFGSAFVHDPFELYRLGVLTNPNLMVLVLARSGRVVTARQMSSPCRKPQVSRRVAL